MASEVFLILTTKLYKSFSAFSLFALFSDEPEVFLPECSQMAILHAADFRRLVNIVKYKAHIPLKNEFALGARRKGN